MGIVIHKTYDTKLLAELNRNVQTIHHNMEPNLFKAYSQANMKNLFDEALKKENVSAYLAYYEDRPVGYMLMSQEAKPENFFRYAYSVLYIDQISVKDGYKGKGVGKALVDYAKAYAIKAHVNRLEMNYWSKNSNSGEFFRSQGFENYNEKLVLKLD